MTNDILEAVARDLSVARRLPVATYRLQLNRSFTFRDARQLVPYLHELGISDVYASPYLKARSGSLHGYDISDHNTLNPEIGTEEEYNEFVQELKAYGMGQILDIVPNHMGIAESSNAWWMDVLENGPSSPFAPFFDIAWIPPKAELKDKVLLPILGDQYGRVLENQELTLTYEDGAFFIYYYETKLPIAPRTYVNILQHRLEGLAEILGSENPHFLELQSIITALSHLPLRSETDLEKVTERRREKEIIKRRLANLCHSCEEVKEFIEENVRLFNGTKGDPRSFDLLDALLDAQAYRLCYWRVAADEINYRRFFDINDLAGIRMENPAVFCETHKLVLRLIQEGKVTGLRIDHPDGLFDPAQYFQRLQKVCFLHLYQKSWALRENHIDLAWEALLEPLLAQYADKHPPSLLARPFHLIVEKIVEPLLARYADKQKESPSPLLIRPFYLIAEKILQKGESLPEDWPIYGTTGYEFMNALNGIFVESANEKLFDDLYARFTRARIHFPELVYEKKKLITRASMSSEINVLGHQLDRLSEKNRWSRDFTLNSLTDAIREIIACFPVYRIYMDASGVKEHDRVYIEMAVARAKGKNPAISASIFDFVRDILLLKYLENSGEEDRAEQLNFVMKFQQCTGPVMAKSLEDTAFYIYNRLVSLNEVGGDPQRFGLSVSAFHRQNLQRCERWPYSLSATSTHDTKRSEDVRARINVLSEVPQEWRACLTRWSRFNRRKKVVLDGQPCPDRNEEYLLYQTLLGVWPMEPIGQAEYEGFKERIQAYMLKAIKEAKVHTSWINPNRAYDEAVQNFVSAVLEDSPDNLFLEDFRVLQRKIAQYGMYNSLSQTLLKVASPGVPDIYQGNETWDFSLVDPDNRRPVDYETQSQLLKTLQTQMAEAGQHLAALARELMQTKEDGRIKLYVTYRALNYRRERKDLFAEGSYLPLEGAGSKKEHICAFARKRGNQTVIVVVPRLLTQLTPNPEEPPLGKGVWEGSCLVLPEEEVSRGYCNIFTGETVETTPWEGKAVLPLEAVFASFPVALLERG